MGESSPILIALTPNIWFGIGLRKLVNWEVAIYFPLFIVSIEFKKKPPFKPLIDFGNYFK